MPISARNKTESPLFEFRLTPLLALSDFQKVAKEYGNYKLAECLYRQMSLLSFSILQDSVNWLNEISKSNGTFDLSKIRSDYTSKILARYPCPLIKAVANTNTDNIGIHRTYQNALLYANLNGISDIDALLYGKVQRNKSKKPLTKRTYSSVGKELIDTVINISYIKFEKYLAQYSNKKSKPDNILALFAGNKSKSDTFLLYLENFNVNKNSKAIHLSALMKAAFDTQLLTKTTSDTQVFRVIASEFCIPFTANARPRYRGKVFEKVYKNAIKYIRQNIH